ncbi:MAG TPA: hypothetical protein VH325_13880 [Bryobacteraceae bacterium]|nr:hypothetical protein [Bryobacteraceae bacterium]
MRVLLDTKDVINLVQKSQPLSVSELDGILRKGRHEIVLSYVNITEIVAPLRQGVDFADIRPLLIALESLPACYIRDSPIPGQELREAISAFEGNRDPNPVDPFVRRWDDVITPFGESALRPIVGVRLWEIVQILYKQGALPDYSREAGQLRAQFQAERALPANQKQNLRDIFVKAVEANLRTYGLTPPAGGVVDFANWLYDNPRWCPAKRITFEMYHSLLRNSTDIPKDSDILDLNHLKALPYVDFLTLDRRMDSYLGAVVKGLVARDPALQVRGKILRNLAEVLSAPEFAD